MIFLLKIGLHLMNRFSGMKSILNFYKMELGMICKTFFLIFYIQLITGSVNFDN